MSVFGGGQHFGLGADELNASRRTAMRLSKVDFRASWTTVHLGMVDLDFGGAMPETELVRFVVRDGTSVIVEVEEERRGSTPAGRRVNGVRDAREFFESNLTHIRDAAEAVLADLRKASSPDEIKIGFGVKLTTEVGAVIARSAVEGNISVELLWRRDDSTDIREP
ncbi:hypothetical protein KBX71_16585 [Micromonospora sp. D93]|uniref:CU044_2847 family protein n=1 Tax=Micromonospora sp. D93 TaxID=2824886 RepID=UPI001B359C8A|nr:CU044_2847 family protein [Micromonospora sp. D93]MBQ1019471.1 hypothetical protein [Micromonospora sp. D93]